jgi:CheY-like chemotaxis protein
MPRVLIVEDDPDLREMMATLLDLEGFETSAAANGAVALAMLDRDVDAIVLDLMMPVMDGWEFRRRQLALPAAARIPVIVVSAVDLHRHGAPASCAAQLPKPVDFDRLIRMLMDLCPPSARAET